MEATINENTDHLWSYCDDCGRYCYTGGDEYQDGYVCEDCEPEEDEKIYIEKKQLKGNALNINIIREMEAIKTRLYEDIELNNLFLDMIEEPMTELENQICCVYFNDYDVIKLPYTTQAEKIRVLVNYWKKIKLVEAFINCELYANYFKFYKDLSDDDYNIMAIKYIVKNNLL